MTNLYIAFSGFWPEKGANLVTRSFKEFEVQASLTRFLVSHQNRIAPPLLIASAGNTGNAYSFLTTLLGLRLYLVVPESGLSNLLLPFRTTARVIAVRGDYSDAIALVERLKPMMTTHTDGGVRNVARRAGMATVYLNAVLHPTQGLHTLFDHYFQAIGSGSGAIATWEAVDNLLRDGRFGTTRTRIHIAQNEPFAPIPEAWERKTRALPIYPPEETRIRIDSVTAAVLSNRNPAYSLVGGIYDVLEQSAGSAWKVNNFEVFEAARTFRETEGVDAGPAGCVAVAALMKAVRCKQFSPSDRILLHITGGGKEIEHTRHAVYSVEPLGVVTPSQVEDAFGLLNQNDRSREARAPFEMPAVADVALSNEAD